MFDCLWKTEAIENLSEVWGRKGLANYKGFYAYECEKITEAERLLRVLEEIKGPGVLGLTGDGAVDMAIREGVIWNDQMGWCHSGA